MNTESEPLMNNQERWLRIARSLRQLDCFLAFDVGVLTNSEASNPRKHES